ncbi:MAG: hypothetical protein K9N06_07925 [Candidatus Cloacimonetes bacterium]|nr:hypothetical protein [Candidatus Cloacimonadota bacterium]
MKKLLVLIFCLIITGLWGQIDRNIIGYYTSWSIYGRDYHVPDIPADKITHINYAFANINSNSLQIMLGDAYADIDRFYPGDSWEPGSLRGSFHQLQILKENHPELKTLISVGGWTWSTCFSLVAATEQSRQDFAASCVAFIEEYGFDGVDIDWEYPVSGGLPGNYYSPDDPENFVFLLAELRQQLDAAGDYLLTAAVPAGPEKIANHDLPGMEPYLDYFNIMAYDFHGPWSGEGDAVTGHLAALYPQTDDPLPEPYNTSYNGSAAVAAYLTAGIASAKINLGIPFYGRGFGGVTINNNGLYQDWINCPWIGTWENGCFDYTDLRYNYIDLNGYDSFWDEEGLVPWIFNPEQQIMITFDDTLSVSHKTEYVNQEELGGVMFWEFSGDRDEELIDEIYRAFSGSETFYGDIDENSIVEAFDASLLLQYYVGLEPLPELDPRPWEEERLQRADVDGDGQLSAFDAALILRFSVGMILQFPVEE